MISEQQPSLYEILLQNVDGELDLEQIGEEDQYILSVLDNLRRILNTRAGSLSHLPDYGLPDMGTVLQGLPSSAQKLIGTLTNTLRIYEPRLAEVQVSLLPQLQPGQLQYALDIQLKGGQQVTFGTTLGAGGRVLVRHLKQQHYVSRR